MVQSSLSATLATAIRKANTRLWVAWVGQTNATNRPAPSNSGQEQPFEIRPKIPQSRHPGSSCPRDVAEFLATPPAQRGSLQEVQKNMPTRIAAMQPHCSSIIRSRSTSAAKASVTIG